MHDVLIIGGGVIGLSLAWDLARHGRSVHVIDQAQPGREASWAGAGILPVATRRTDQHPYDQLRGLACERHPHWAKELQAATGIDTGFRRCGGVHLARTPGEAAALTAWAALQREEGIEVSSLSEEELSNIESGLAFDDRYNDRRSVRSTQYSVLSTSSENPFFTSVCVPAESQLRNPWHLRALATACELANVLISPNVVTTEIILRQGQVAELATSLGPIRAKQYCFTAGAWTGQLLSRLGISTGILPIRGQMVLFRCASPPIRSIINEGSRYLVPRDDGYVLVGSTEEEVGFDKRTTTESIDELTEFARALVPALRGATIEQTWAGLRPGSFDGLPYIGPLPGLKNAFVAAGHFRSGLFLSTATAVIMSELLRGMQPQIDLSPFRIGR